MKQIFSYISNLDSAIIHAVQSIGSEWRLVAMFLSYGLGWEMLIVVFVIALFLLRRHRIAFELLAIFFVSVVVTYVLKELFHAPRPYIIDSSIIPYDADLGWGLPSAHATLSVVILGWVAIRHPKSHILLWGSIIIVILVGWSRIYLGVHYPLQVIAGWLLGILLLYIFHRMYKRLWSPFQNKFK